MAAASHPWIAREGWFYIALFVGAALAVALSAGWLWSLPVWLPALFVLQFFRDPPRFAAPGHGDGVLLAPADGRVVFVGRGEDPYLQRSAVKISIFMNVFSVHSNRAPLAGEVKERWYTHGKFLNAALDKSSLENERNALWIRGAGDTDVVCVQIAGLVARRIHCYCKPGDSLRAGERYGFIRFGSRVDLYCDPQARIKVGLGDKVYAGRDALAELQRPGATDERIVPSGS